MYWGFGTSVFLDGQWIVISSNFGRERTVDRPRSLDTFEVHP